MSAINNDFETNFFNLVLRHCVNITVFDRTEGKTAHENRGVGRLLIISGFVISVDGKWFLITAGHCLRNIEASREAGQNYHSWELDDGTRPNAQAALPIPFDYDNIPKFAIVDKESGVDYAAFYLRPYYQNLLVANGIQPFPDPWRKDITGDFTAYILLGVPNETIEAKITDDGIYQRCRPTAIGLTRIDQPTGVLIRGDWFYAKLPDANGEYYVDSIEGMSGGPIIGFGKGNDDRPCYWVLALQSSWDRSKREIRACPIAIFAKEISEGIKKNLGGKEI